MHILLLAPQPFFRVRGTPINVRNMATALGEAGHQVDVLCYPFGEDFEAPGVRILRSPGIWGVKDVPVGPSLPKIPLDCLMFLKAIPLCMKHDYDVIHGIEEAGFMAAALARWRKTPFIFDMDSCISDQLKYSGKLTWKPALRFIERLERRTMKRSAFVLTVCQALSDTVHRMAPKAKVVQIEDAPLEETFVPMPERAASLRKELNLEGRNLFVYTGNLEPYQGLDLLLDALSESSMEQFNGCCIIVGGEPEQVEHYRNRVTERGLIDRCIFLGKRPLSEMPAYLTLADVLISPRTQGENTALKVYTYMQSAKPIVATRLPTHTQVLDDTCAYLCEPTATDFAEGLMVAGKDTAASDRGAVAAARVESDFSLAVFKRRVTEAYQALTAET